MQRQYRARNSADCSQQNRHEEFEHGTFKSEISLPPLEPLLIGTEYRKSNGSTLQVIAISFAEKRSGLTIRDLIGTDQPCDELALHVSCELMLHASHWISRFATAIRITFLGAVAATALFSSTLTVYLAEGNRSVSAQFAAVGDVLTITLSNNATTFAHDNSDVIYGLFFNLAGNGQLTPSSAAVLDPNGVVNGGSASDIGYNWAYGWNIAGPHLATQGISSGGFGLFGRGNFCGAPNCGNKLQGSNWGIVGAYSPGSGNHSIDDVPLIQSAAVFTLSGLPQGFDPSTGISDVSAQYTASLSGPNLWSGGSIQLAAVPEPGSLVLIGAGLIALGTLRRTKRG